MLSTSPLIKTYTLEEFWALPEPKDGSKLELIAGVLYMTPQPELPHNLSSTTLNKLLNLHLAKRGDAGLIFCPRAALWTSPATCVEPDLFYISERTSKQIDMNKPSRADLVVEIISPGTAIYDRNTKADTYAALGVRELWLVDPSNHLIEVRNLKPRRKGQPRRYNQGQVFTGRNRVVSQVLPGFTPSVTEICQVLPRKTR
jgi:Uma2 family endonuclease